MVEKETHFIEFARLLYEEVVQNAISTDKGLFDVEAFEQEQYRIISRRAYDLVEHACRFITEPMTHWTTEDMLDEIPDMAEWPE